MKVFSKFIAEAKNHKIVSDHYIDSGRELHYHSFGTINGKPFHHMYHEYDWDSPDGISVGDIVGSHHTADEKKALVNHIKKHYEQDIRPHMGSEDDK